MGYWSKHPLGGDSPYDAISAIKHLLYGWLTPEEFAEINKHCGERGYEDAAEATEDLYFEYKAPGEGDANPLYVAARRAVNDHLPELVALAEGGGAGFTFELPFLIAERGWHLRPEVLAASRTDLIALVGDGGAGERGYHEFLDDADADLLAQVRPGEEPPSPAHYAAALRSDFDAFVTGARQFDAEEGLIAACGKKLGGASPGGLVNCD